jgi:biotin carboxyl carrier protein
MAMEVRAPLTGTVLRVLVQEGEEVAGGDTVAVLESMKMEIEVNSSFEGVVKQIVRIEGEVVQAEEALILLE